MGGNATKHLGTQRIDKETYLKISAILSDILLWNTDWEPRIYHRFKLSPIPYIAEKENFGDMDIVVLEKPYCPFAIDNLNTAIHDHTQQNQQSAEVIGFVKNGNILSVAM